MAAAKLLSGLVFVLFLLRHALSCALGLFPAENWLWRMSLAFGFNLLPILTALRDQAGCGAAGTFVILAALVAASQSKSFFFSILALHMAAVAVWFCWIVAIARYGPPFDLAFKTPHFALVVGAPNQLGVLAICLLLACVHGHIRYIETLRAK